MTHAMPWANGRLFRRELWQRTRASLRTISALVLLTLVGCKTAAPVSPLASPTSPLPGSVTPTSLPTAAVEPTTESGFAIYLTDPQISPEQLAILSHLELEHPPLLSMQDIVAYTRATHEIALTAAGYERIFGLSVPTQGRAFAVCVNGEPVYTGAFWAPYSSQSFSGVVIDPFLATQEKPVIQIQLGYPGEGFFRGDDPRSDPRLFSALEQAGKLR